MFANLISTILAASCAMTLASAATPSEGHLSPVQISAACKDMFYGSQGAQPDIAYWDPTSAKPQTYIDRRSLITFHVASDGRHVSAISSDGKPLWVSNPFEDAGLCPYRTPWPVISSIGSGEYYEELAKSHAFRNPRINVTHKFVEIRFDSSQYGMLDETTGKFFFLGQN